MRRYTKDEIIKRILFTIFSVLLIISGAVFYRWYTQKDVYNTKKMEDDLKSKVITDVYGGSDDKKEVKEEKPKDNEGNDIDPNLVRNIDFNYLMGINSRASRWLYIPNSSIDFTVIQEDTVHSTNYLDADIYGNYSDSGSAITPAIPGGSSANFIIYAHRMYYADVDLGFTALPKMYGDFDSAINNQYVYLYEQGRTTRYRVWSAVDIVNDNPIYELPYDKGSEDYQSLLNSIPNYARFLTDLSVDKNDDILVLSTCEGARHGIYRFAVVFVKDQVYDKAENRILYNK